MTSQFKALNGLRFPACVLIFTQHLPPWSYPAGTWFADWAPRFMAQAHAAMPYFFVLSGFVLAHAYGGLLLPGRDVPPARAIQHILLRRAIRLFPLHWLGLLLILPLAVLTDAVAAPALLAHLTLTQALALDPGSVYAFNWPSWSLSAELVFALLFPALLLTLAMASRRQGLLLLAGAMLAPLLAAIAVDQLGRMGYLVLYINPFARLADFAAGILLYLLWRQFRWRCDGLAWELAPVALLMAAILGTADLAFPYRLVAFFLPVAVLFTLVFAAGDGPLRRTLSGPTALWLGRLAFAFYVVHFIVIRYVELTPLARLAPDDGLRWFLIPLLFVLSLLAAIAIHHGFERQIEPRLRNRLTPKRSAVS
ncbi:MAG: acyltransferase family protein [Reyranellaceae bacterium]